MILLAHRFRIKQYYSVTKVLFETIILNFGARRSIRISAWVLVRCTFGKFVKRTVIVNPL